MKVLLIAFVLFLKVDSGEAQPRITDSSWHKVNAAAWTKKNLKFSAQEGGYKNNKAIIIGVIIGVALLIAIIK